VTTHDDDAGNTDNNPSDKSDSKDDDSSTNHLEDRHDDADDEYPPNDLDIPIAGVLEEYENEKGHKIEGVPEEPEPEVKADFKEMQMIPPQ
jgi:hypothetical protein